MREINTILLIGFGAVGQALTPLLLSHFRLPAGAITVIDRNENLKAPAMQLGVRFHCARLTENNFSQILHDFAAPGSWLINLAVEVSSIDLMHWCQAHDVLYLDTCIEPWTGAYCIGQRGNSATNYELRQRALSQRKKDCPTAVVAHGANPGLVTHFAKAALKELARKNKLNGNYSWAQFAQALGIRCIQIAERDTQHCETDTLNDNLFANTWSVDAFMAEAWQRSELGWGTHETRLPKRAQRHDDGDRAAIYLDRRGAEMRVKSWVPSCGEMTSLLITHHEACSLAHLLTLNDSAGNEIYRPTTYFAYQPSPMTLHSLLRWKQSGFANPMEKRVCVEELINGFDELGVLLLFQGGCYWYGSTLTLDETRAIAPHNNATTLQVVAGILGALTWMQHNPYCGVVEAEDMDHELVLDVARPLLGRVRGVLSDWQPVPGTQLQFDDFVVR